MKERQFPTVKYLLHKLNIAQIALMIKHSFKIVNIFVAKNLKNNFKFAVE